MTIAVIEQATGPGANVRACQKCAWDRHRAHVVHCKACEQELCETGRDQRRWIDETAEERASRNGQATGSLW